jgi:hypothetical protein
METGTLRHPRGGLFRGILDRPRFRHGLTRTVTQMDNMLFSNMTLNRSRCISTRIFARRKPNGADRS